jgi:hypothetical protein
MVRVPISAKMYKFMVLWLLVSVGKGWEVAGDYLEETGAT